MRDLRDPQVLGEVIIRRIEVSETLGDRMTGSQAAKLVNDNRGHEIGDFVVPDYAHDASLVSVTMRQYQEEITAQAAEGDESARRLCREKGWSWETIEPLVISERDEDVRGHASSFEHSFTPIPHRICLYNDTHAPHTFTDENDGVWWCPGLR